MPKAIAKYTASRENEKFCAADNFADDYKKDSSQYRFAAFIAPLAPGMRLAFVIKSANCANYQKNLTKYSKYAQMVT